jgi:hypothetical protein
MKQVFLLITFFVIISFSTYATNIRGYVGSRYGGALRGCRVDIWIWNGAKYVDWGYSVTDVNGFYYFMGYQYGLRFFIQINGLFYPNNPGLIGNINPPLFQDFPAIYL